MHTQCFISFFQSVLNFGQWMLFENNIFNVYFFLKKEAGILWIYWVNIKVVIYIFWYKFPQCIHFFKNTFPQCDLEYILIQEW